jgi:hemoglobin-like flavoprotein
MNEEELALFLDSFERCVKNERFIQVFYDIFLNSSEEIPVFFKDTNFTKQRRVLRSALFELVSALARRSVDLTPLAALTERHRTMNIKPHHYDLWMQSLIGAVAECDRYYSDEIARVWREAFQVGIDYMKIHAC